jgi:S1-C subfamily serine protease
MPFDNEYIWRPEPPPVPPRRPRPASPLGSLLVIVLTVLLTVAATVGALKLHDHLVTPVGGAEPRAVTPRGDLMDLEKTTVNIYNNAKPSVVHITTTGLRRDAFFNVQEVPEGTGSGFIWDDLGHVVTNYHVVRNARSVYVTLWDQTTYEGTVIGAQPNKDLAVLRIDAPKAKLRPIPVGKSADLQVGQKAFAIGNPFGLDHTLTTGVVSALNRQIESVTHEAIKGAIQTDAAINPGNSGGTLLDSAGRLIGVNTAIYSPSGTSAGIGFAIPVDTVNEVVPQLIAKGS